MASRNSSYFTSTPLETPRGVSRRQTTVQSTAPNGTTSLKTVVKEKDSCESDLHRQVHTDIHGSTAGMVPAPVAVATVHQHVEKKTSAWGWLAMAILFLILFFVFWWVVFMTFQVSWIKSDNGQVSYSRLGLSALVGSFITVVIIGIIAALVRRKC